MQKIYIDEKGQIHNTYLGHSKKLLVSHHSFLKNQMRHAFFPHENFKTNTVWMGNLHIFYRTFTVLGIVTLFFKNLKVILV